MPPAASSWTVNGDAGFSGRFDPAGAIQLATADHT
jgi:hypothetical protein